MPPKREAYALKYAQVADVRERFAWFPRYDIGLIAVTGSDRYTWLQGMVSNDTRLLASGAVQRLPAFILDETGHIRAEVVLINAGSAILLDVAWECLSDIMSRLDRLIIMEDVVLTDVSKQYVNLSAQGPDARSALEPWAEEAVALVEADHSGSGGWDWYGTRAMYASGKRRAGCTPKKIDTIAAELLRIEAGIPASGKELTSDVIALETGLVSTHISMTKGCYVGQEVIARIDARGHTNRELTGIVQVRGQKPENIYALKVNDRQVGRITSSTRRSPAVYDKPIALAYVRHEHRAPGTLLEGGNALLEVVELPFYRRGG